MGNKNRNMKNIIELLPLLAATSTAITLDMIDCQTENSLPVYVPDDLIFDEVYPEYNPIDVDFEPIVIPVPPIDVDFEPIFIPAPSTLQDNGQERCDIGGLNGNEIDNNSETMIGDHDDQDNFENSDLQDNSQEECDIGSFWDEELCMCVPSWSCYILCGPDEFLHPVNRCYCINYNEFQEEFGDTCGQQSINM